MDRRISAIFFDLGDTLGTPILSVSPIRLVGFSVFPYGRTVLAKLRERGLRLGVISNTGEDDGATVNRVLEDANLLQPFDHDLLIYSRDVQMTKSSPGIFRLAAERAGQAVAAERCLFVGEDAKERATAADAGWSVCPHPLLVSEVLDGEDLHYVRVTVPGNVATDEWRRTLAALPIVPVHKTGARGAIVYAIASTRKVSTMMNMRFDVQMLGPPNAPLRTDLYILRDDAAAASGFLSPAGQSARLLAQKEDARLVFGSTHEGLIVGLPPERSLEDFHFDGAGHGHTIKLMPDPALLETIGEQPATSFASGFGPFQRLTTFEIAELSKIDSSSLLERAERYGGHRPIAPGSVTTISSRHIFHLDNELAAKAVGEELQTIGQGRLAVRLHRFTQAGRQLYNVEAELQGVTSELVLVTAHLDSTAAESDGYDATHDPAPGIDDDASGMAAVTSIAERFVELSKNSPPLRTIRFVLFNAEEQGLVGSKAYARQQRSVGAPIVGVFQMDMIGYNRVPPRSWEVHVGFAASAEVEQRSLELARLIEGVCAQVAPGLLPPQIYTSDLAGGDPAAGRSDHAPFQAVGYAACVASEDFFVGPTASSPEQENNPNYHKKEDDEIDGEFAADIARVVAAAAWVAARKDGVSIRFGEEATMAGEIAHTAQLSRDPDGKVRQIRHAQSPFTGSGSVTGTRGVTGTSSAMAAPSPRQLADLYVREQVADLLDLNQGMLENFSAPLERTASGSSKQELRFKEEKTVSGSTTVSYAQTVYSLPIWQSGLTVRMRSDPLAVIGAQNELHYGIEVEQPPSDARYLPDRVTDDVLQKLLPLPARGRIPTISGRRVLIYQYDPLERLDQEASNTGSSDTLFEAGPPTLPLAPVPDTIKAGMYYVVTEILFNYAPPGRGPLNWRAFIEPETGTVLYLRALVACAHAMVFRTDPVTETGTVITGASPANDLDPLRVKVELLGLNAPATSAPARQRLEGTYVRLADRQSPTSEAPREPAPFDFSYPVRTSDFAAANAYHHCDGLFRLVEGMGFVVSQYFDGTHFPVTVDHYALGGEVNAEAPGNETGTGSDGFNFGIVKDGHPVGIACDPRVVLHEFGHALLWDHVGSPNFGFAHSAGDSLAAILHDSDSRARDSGDTFPFMTASVGIDRRHDRSVEEGWAWGGIRDNRQYGSEQILSTTLFRVYKAAGGASLDRAMRRQASRYVAYLIIKAIGTLTFTTRNPEVYVNALMDADLTTGDFEGRPGGLLHKVIRWSFEKQGLYQPAGAPRPVARPGLAPEVDVYVKDSLNGEYRAFSAEYENTLGIWNRRAPDGQDGHEIPVIGAVNSLYVRVANRGTGMARNVSVRAFRSSRTSEHVWPTDFTDIDGAATLPTIAANGTALVGPIPWTPDGANSHVLVSVDADGDPSNIGGLDGNAPCSLLVQLDNNIALRRIEQGIS